MAVRREVLRQAHSQCRLEADHRGPGYHRCDGAAGLAEDLPQHLLAAGLPDRQDVAGCQAPNTLASALSSPSDGNDCEFENENERVEVRSINQRYL